MLKASDIPNLISAARMVLVFPVIWLLLHEQFSSALWLFLVAGISDALDGFLAKTFHWQSHLGGILDPLADKLMLVSTYVCLALLGALPVWLVGLVILRDLVIIIGGVVYNYRVERFEAEPSIISKLNTFMQILLVLVVVFNLAGSPVPDWLPPMLIWVVVFTTLASGLGYVIKWSRRAREHDHEQ